MGGVASEEKVSLVKRKKIGWRTGSVKKADRAFCYERGEGLNQLNEKRIERKK